MGEAELAEMTRMLEEDGEVVWEEEQPVQNKNNNNNNNNKAKQVNENLKRFDQTKTVFQEEMVAKGMSFNVRIFN